MFDDKSDQTLGFVIERSCAVFLTRVFATFENTCSRVFDCSRSRFIACRELDCRPFGYESKTVSKTGLSRSMPLPYISCIFMPKPSQSSCPYFAYLLVYSLASFSYDFRSFLYSSAILVSTASSGFGSLRSCLANSNIALILVLGFHASGLKGPRHIRPVVAGAVVAGVDAGVGWFVPDWTVAGVGVGALEFMLAMALAGTSLEMLGW